jgi:hypothetical protein
MPERLTRETESGSWQTPTVEDAGRQGSADDWKKYEQDGQTSGCRLRNQVQMWPTPRANKTTDEDEETWIIRHAAGKVATPPLALAVKMFPTPCATDHKGAGKTGTLRDRLDYAAERGATKSNVYATPQARDFRTGEAHRWENPERSRNLNDQVASMYPTPMAQDHKGCTKPDAMYKAAQRGFTPNLQEHVAAQEHGGQLNPTWVEWLMGWPLGWTDLKPLGTDKFQSWRHSHGGF